jgi:hypothetical protein
LGPERREGAGFTNQTVARIDAWFFCSYALKVTTKSTVIFQNFPTFRGFFTPCCHVYFIATSIRMVLPVDANWLDLCAYKELGISGAIGRTALMPTLLRARGGSATGLASSVPCQCLKKAGTSTNE